MKKLISALIFIFILSSISFGCSIAHLPLPIAGASKGSYIFIGEVVGYTEVIKSRSPSDESKGNDKFYGEGRGLKIKPIEIINMPNPAGDYVELFQFGVESDCSPRLMDAAFPVGTKLRIVANAASLLPNRNSEGQIRLESRIFDLLSVVKENDKFVTSAGSIFDYKILKPPQATEPENRAAFSDFLFVEINKDLLRLERAATKKERYEILERLLYAPGIDYPRLVNPGLRSTKWTFLRLMRLNGQPELPAYITEPNIKRVKLTSTEKNLLKQWEELEKSGYFNF